MRIHRSRPAPDGTGPEPAAGGTPSPGPEPDDAAREAVKSGWHPGVRLVLVLLVLLPILATGIFTASGVRSGWSYRQHAQVVARDASELETVAAARAEMNPLEIPLTAVSYAEGLGISADELDALLKPSVPYQVQMADSASAIARFPTFSSTPTMRADVVQLEALIPRVEQDTVSYDDVGGFMKKMSSDIDNIWYADYNRLLADVSAWQPPGAFEVHASALRQAYAAFLAGGQEIEGALFVLEGIGPPDAKQELIQAAGVFDSATAEFAGHLPPQAQAAWRALETDPADKAFQGTIQQGVNVALNGLPAPFFGNLTFAGSSMVPGLRYLADLNRLVTAASQDLRDAALAQSAAATSRFVSEIVFLLILVMLSVGGVVIVGRILTRPLQRLAAIARQVHSGDFDVEPLSERGPREVVTTTAAFNDMASTLEAVEAKAVALAAEDLSHLESLTPLPGRTGRALQRSVDTLAARIKEREVQRQLLQEAATHDQLTGLLNRAAVLDHLTNDVSRRRQAGETVAVMFVDLDGLKPLNDTYGHETGDAAIVSTGVALMESTGDCDVVGRLGGDEFLIVLCHEHSHAGEAIAEHIRQSVSRRSIPIGESVVPLEASVGVALTQCDSDTDPMLLVRQADEAMYEAKKAARAVRERMATA